LVFKKGFLYSIRNEFGPSSIGAFFGGGALTLAPSSEEEAAFAAPKQSKHREGGAGPH